MVDFVATSKRIVAALNVRSTGMTQDERMRYVYNEAMKDAANFVHDLSESNPVHRMAYMALEREMREWLPLRSEDK